MTQKVQNLSRRLVSFTGNSGQTWHLPPRTSLELPDFELSKNAMVEKLKSRRLIHMLGAEKKEHEAEHKEHEAEHHDKERGKKHSHRPAR